MLIGAIWKRSVSQTLPCTVCVDVCVGSYDTYSSSRADGRARCCAGGNERTATVKMSKGICKSSNSLSSCQQLSLVLFFPTAAQRDSPLLPRLPLLRPSLKHPLFPTHVFSLFFLSLSRRHLCLLSFSYSLILLVCFSSRMSL